MIYILHTEKIELYKKDIFIDLKENHLQRTIITQQKQQQKHNYHIECVVVFFFLKKRV